MTEITERMPGYTTTPVRGSDTFNPDVQVRMNEMAANATALNVITGQINTVAGEVNNNAVLAGERAGIATTKASEASGSADSAAGNAAIAAGFADSIIATSSSSVLIGTGLKTFTVQAGKQFSSNPFVSIVSAADTDNYMHGVVSSYSGTTLTADVSNVGGSGTYSDWGISLSGSRGPIGTCEVHGNELHDENFIADSDYATPTTGGTLKVRLNGTTAYFTTNGNNA